MTEGDVSVLHELLFAPLVAGRHVDITGKFQALGLSKPSATESERRQSGFVRWWRR